MFNCGEHIRAITTCDSISYGVTQPGGIVIDNVISQVSGKYGSIVINSTINQIISTSSKKGIVTRTTKQRVIPATTFQFVRDIITNQRISKISRYNIFDSH